MSGAFLVADHVRVALAGREVLRDVSFALPRQGLVALAGPNGAGKTTLLRALAQLLPPNAMTGAITLDGKDVTALTIRQRALRFAYLPQGHVVAWPLPARDIVALGRTPHGATDPSRLAAIDAAAVDRAMQATDVTAFADRRVTELSGGERSRVALARVLAVEAPVILADEPIASLDPHYQLEVMATLRRAADGGVLVVVVTHDLGFAARFADQILVLDGGCLVAQGPAETALTDTILAETFRVKVFRTTHEDGVVLTPWSGAS
jgi:iron complex transport system ATP-binding protein